MEHRKSQRVPAHLSVLIYQKGLPVAVAMLRNISKGGLFVATDFDGVDINQKLDVEFRLSGRHDAHPKWVSAIVVRKTDLGLGLECDDSDDFRSDAVSDLFYWLRSTSLAGNDKISQVRSM